ncbi:3721_t:CDS:2, partial [Entrophospora sp. SA101]
LPTPSVPSVHGFQVQYLSEALFYMDDLFDFYKEKHWRRLRWSNYIGKQKAMDKICRRIANNERTVVAFGHAPFSSSSKGHAAE